MFKIMKTVKLADFCSWLTQIIFILCAVAFSTVILDPNLSAKILGVAGATALFVTVVNYRKITSNKAFYICLILFLIGMCDMIWYGLFKDGKSPAINSYRAYLEVGKICLFGAFVLNIFTLQNDQKIGHYKVHYVIAAILQLTILGYAFYQGVWMHRPRVEFSLGGGTSATGAAYTAVFISCYTLAVLQHLKIRIRDLLILMHFVSTLLVLIATETRAAILVYPVIFMALVLIKFFKEKHFTWKGIVVIGIAFFAGILVMKDSLMHRYNDFNRDISAYEKNDTYTSIGARLAMWETGYYSAKNNYLWQSTDQRNQLIKMTVERDPGLKGAVPYMVGHLHNEIIETWSLKGPSGLVLYFMFIIAVAWYALRVVKSYILLAFLVSMIMFGISGVMFYSKTTPVAWMLTLLMSVLFLNQNLKSKALK